MPERPIGELTAAEWEALCRRCGLCCFEKWRDGNGTLHYTSIACDHLDVISRQCRVYAKRLEMGVGCIRLTPENVGRLDWLPKKCAYRQLAANAKKETE